MYFEIEASEVVVYRKKVYANMDKALEKFYSDMEPCTYGLKIDSIEEVR